MKIFFPISINLMFWGLIGFTRWVIEEKIKKQHLPPADASNIAAMERKVAVCISAHNEEATLGKTLDSLKQLVPAHQIYVANDGSTDRTAEVVRDAGCNVLEIYPNKGKAGALETILQHFAILDTYQFVLFADADTTFDKQYLKKALPLFAQNKKIVTVTAYGYSQGNGQGRFGLGTFLLAYRSRLWRILQKLLTYGQTWHPMNVYPVVPGYASIYRTSALRHLKIEIPGLAIEDFNMAFQIHKKKLGIIAYHPSIIAVSQDPDNFEDYCKQLMRWNVGFFQTIKYWKVWPSKFWVPLTIFILENMFIALFGIMVPVILLAALLFSLDGSGSSFLQQEFVVFLLTGFAILYAADYLLTLLIAMTSRNDMMSVYGLGFFFLYYVNSVIFLIAIPRAFFTTSDGRWISPKRLT